MDANLKHRLVGALVLVAVAVLFLPSLFSDERQRKVDTRTQVPPGPALEPLQIAAPVEPDNIPAAKPAEQMYQLVEADAPADDKPKSSALAADGLPLAWVVQVASFKTKARALGMRDQLIAEGYKAYLRTIKTSKGAATRVMVGPMVEKQRALTVKNELDKANNLDSMVLKFRP